VIFAVYAVFSFIDLRGDIAAKQAEIDAIQKEVDAQQIYNDQLAELADSELTESEIADIAREKLGYAMPGERVFIDITGK
jgi:cell division protein DivIC